MKEFENFICPGCSLYCDDIKLIFSDKKELLETYGICLKGYKKVNELFSQNRIKKPMIRKNGEIQEVSYEEAFNRVKELLKSSNKPFLYGFVNTSCEAQIKGIELARKINGYIESNASYCHGQTYLSAIETGFYSTTLTECVNKGDTFIFWGSNAADSHPKFLTKTIFSRGKFRITGREIKTLILVDPRKTATFGAAGVRDLYIPLQPGKDLELIRFIKDFIDGEKSQIPSDGFVGIDKQDLNRLIMNLQDAENGVILFGQGVINSDPQGAVIRALIELVDLVNKKLKRGRYSIIPMTGHNMNGFIQVALSFVGKTQQIEFSNDNLVDNNKNFASKVKEGDFDLSIIVASDPISNLPVSISSELSKKPLIAIDCFHTPTTRIADVVLPSAITGLEAGGLVYRMDNVPMNLKIIFEPTEKLLTDEQILKKIISNVEG
jgi:formylmethanofuran dehydrogenase subunit B